MEEVKDKGTGKVTEQRVTRTVIRRRAGAPAPAAPEVVVAPEVAPLLPESETVSMPPPPPEPVAPVVVEALEPVSTSPTPKAPEPEKPVVEAAPVIPPPQIQLKREVIPAPDDSASRYRRIKVVATPTPSSTNYGPKVVSMPDPSKKKEASTSHGPVASPYVGLGRKEIIEIRDFHKPKGGKKKRMVTGKGKKTEITTPKAQKRIIRVTQEAITVSDLAKKMSVKAGDVIQKLLVMGTIVTINQSLDLDTATLAAAEFGYEIEKASVSAEDLLSELEKGESTPESETLEPRAPVVTVMGHVDHGKTSLLDAIRQTEVAAGEAGGITQAIGAYSVHTSNGRMVTFIDTPGHEAFTAMRARGAKITDVVVLVVAADDGVMPQTKEAANHARSANVPIIVAINKMDKQGADPERIKKALTEFNLVPEEWGGDTIYVPVSAKTGKGVTELLETIALQTDVLELKANSKRAAKGTVIESQLDKRRGSVMTVLVQNGTLHEGDVIVAGTQWGRVRAMNDDKGKRIREAGPAYAVEVMGLSGMATAGDGFLVVDDERKAKQYAEMRQKSAREADLVKSSKVSLEDLYQKVEQGDVKELKIVVKADTSGSVEVLADTLEKLSTPKVAVHVIHGGVGGISESDIMLASASQAMVVGFNVRPDSTARTLAERQAVEIRLYDVIYTLTDDIQKAMAGMLAPKKVEQFVGRAQVRQVFNISKIGTIAGCGVQEGKILRSSTVRLIRDSVPIYTGKLSSLKRFKDDVREVTQGAECGIGIENFNDIKVGDVIEAFQVQEVAATLE